MPVEVDESNLPAFELPSIADNESGWGPCIVSSNFDGIPFAPFNKNDRLGRISDWTLQGQQNQRGGRGGRGRYPQQFGMGTGLFQYKHEDDESSFSLVDNRPKPKTSFGRGRGRTWTPNPNYRAARGRGGWQNRGRGKNQWGNNRNWGYNRYGDRTPDPKDASVEVSEDWKLVDSLDFGDLEKASFRTTEEPENLVECGTLELYSSAFDRISPKNPKTLLRFESRQHFTATTSQDPVIQKLLKDKAGDVYATDTILSVLMAAPRSVNSWDLLVKKENGAIVIDKRPGSKIDFLSVNENWNEIQQTDKESVNHPVNLSREATLINHNFSQQCVSKEEVIDYKEANPFKKGLEKGMEAASGAFHYRRFNLDGIRLVARCQVNGFCKRQGTSEKLLVNVRALNEFDSKLSGNVDWRQKLETQTGAVLATEMKNNSCKLARWTAETVLAGVEEFRLGFVSRVYPKDSYKHSILMTKRFEPTAFARSINVKISNLWGVLHTIIQSINNQEDGTYLIIKDPNKTEIHIHEIPADAFEHEHQMMEGE